MEGLIIKSTGTWYRAQLDSGEEVNARIRGKLKQAESKVTNPVAVGDRVSLELINDEYMISAVSPRDNYIIRQSPRKKHHDHLIAANIDQAMLLATLKIPKTSLGFIDRFLVTLEAFRIPGIVVFNKIDLLSNEELEQLNYYCFLYEQKVGYPCLKISLQTQAGLARVNELLFNKTTLLSGHSGTGKSTLINHLIPNADQKTSEVSGFANKGVHTTTFAEMFFMDQNRSSIIDTPGIKELALSEIDNEELGHYFPEMRAYLGQCRYHNCVHVNEPGCKIKEGMEEGTITDERYYSYLSILEGDDNRR